jgi:hypothetical protein
MNCRLETLKHQDVAKMRYLALFIQSIFIVFSQPALANEATKCFEKAWAHPGDDGLGLNRGQATSLCNGATNAVEVIKCFEKAWAHPDDKGLGLNKGQAVALCNSTSNADETTKCFVKAWAHPGDGGLGLHRGGAIDLCTSGPKSR